MKQSEIPMGESVQDISEIAWGSLSEHVYCYEDKDITEDLKAAGYDGPGWYFWDETGAHCHGPFSTREESKENLELYARNL